MASIFVRVELHQGTWENYEKLHRQMELQGFSRTILGNDNRLYKLPTATYYSERYATIAAADRAARDACDVGGTKYWIVVIESMNCMFSLEIA